MNKTIKKINHPTKIIYTSCCVEFPRKVNEILWYSIMRYFDIKNHHYSDNNDEVFGVNPDYVINHDNFIVKSYSWNECDDVETNEINQESDLWKHNNGWHFWHKPSGFKLSYYKYPLRDPYSNMEITSEEFCDILNDCQNSLHPKCITEITPWWENTQFIHINR